MILKKNTFFIYSVLIIQLSIALIFFLYYQNDFITSNPDFFAVDALNYREKAIIFATSDFSIIEFISHYGLNWSSISILGSIAYFNDTYNDWIILIFNTILLSTSYALLIKILNFEKNRLSYGILILFIFYSYIPYSLVQLNKELIGFSYIIFLLYNFYKRKKFILLVTAIVFGIIRIQYLVIGLELFILLLFQYSRSLKLLFILNLLLMNIITVLFIPPLIETWHSNVGGSVNSFELMRNIENRAHIPVVGALAFLERIGISLFVGLTAPMKLYDYDVIKLNVFIYQSSIFIMSIFSLASIYIVYKLRRIKLSEYPLLYSTFIVLIVFLSVNSLAPFLQPRYYLPVTILMFLIYTFHLKLKTKDKSV